MIVYYSAPSTIPISLKWLRKSAHITWCYSDKYLPSYEETVIDIFIFTYLINVGALNLRHRNEVVRQQVSIVTSDTTHLW